ncbi:MAG: alpha/beta fold hydrolase [Planctomycetaceae bacterium]|jgi:pimeloyl-ACP methyl ester carboxylesterase|nr:alpha/beta fold hydrolase [Planctomycetaceae bacterium]
MKTYQLADTNLAVIEGKTGKSAATRNIVFLHGFPFDRTMWLDLCAALTRQCNENKSLSQYRYIVPDLRGFGRSGVQAIGSTTTMEQFAADISQLLDALAIKDKIILCGLSMGGYVASAFARGYGNRLAALILCDTKLEPDTATAAENRIKLAASLDSGNETVENLTKNMLPNILSPTTLSEKPEIVKRVKTMMQSQSPTGLAAAARGMATRQDTTKVITELNIPILTMAGKEDKLTPPATMQSITKTAKQSESKEIPNAAHLPPIESPQNTAEVIVEFLNKI